MKYAEAFVASNFIAESKSSIAPLVSLSLSLATPLLE
jgi:hypothetical protein